MRRRDLLLLSGGAMTIATKTLGLTVPASILARADEVIE
jgi:hypothetical protein